MVSSHPRLPFLNGAGSDTYSHVRYAGEFSYFRVDFFDNDIPERKDFRMDGMWLESRHSMFSDSNIHAKFSLFVLAGMLWPRPSIHRFVL